MNQVMALLLLNGVLGAIDTLWYHEWKAKLPSRGGAIRLELALHAGRDAVYAVIYGTLGWVAWTGTATALLAALIGLEIVITLSDFVVEDRHRPAIGGIPAGERVLHSLMAIVYGAMLAKLLPVMATWWSIESGFTAHERLGAGPPLAVAIVASLFGIGIALSGVRDALSAIRGHAVPAATTPATRPRPVIRPRPATASRATPRARRGPIRPQVLHR